MSTETIASYLAFFTDHLYAIVFLAAAIDATGFPFPGRLLLITAGALAANGAEASRVVLSASAGAFVGDHALYLLGRRGGDRVLSLYCRWTMGSSRCIENAMDYFRRFGGLAIVIGRFVTGVRLFAAALAGSGGIRYSSFLFFDAIGILLWAGTFALLGYFLGAQVAAVLGPYKTTVLVVGIGLALIPPGLVAYRLWKRRRHGPATSPQQSSKPRPAPSLR